MYISSNRYSCFHVCDGVRLLLGLLGFVKSSVSGHASSSLSVHVSAVIFRQVLIPYRSALGAVVHLCDQSFVFDAACFLVLETHPA